MQKYREYTQQTISKSVLLGDVASAKPIQRVPTFGNTDLEMLRDFVFSSAQS